MIEVADDDEKVERKAARQPEGFTDLKKTRGKSENKTTTSLSLDTTGFVSGGEGS